MYIPQSVDPTNAQDALRSVRSFVNTLAGIANDQSWDNIDAKAYTQPYQYQVVGATGTAVEGSTVATSNNRRPLQNNDLMLLILGAAVVYVLTK